MKVLFLSSNVFGRSTGGVEFHMYYLAKKLARLGVDVEVISPVFSSYSAVVEEKYDDILVINVHINSRIAKILSSLERFQGRGIGMLIAFLNKIKMNLFYKQIEKIINERSPDLIHQHDYLASLLLSKSISKNFPVVWTNHLGEYLYLEKNRLSKIIQRYFISHYRHIIAPSHELLPQRLNCTYIYNGVDTSFFSPIKNEAKEAIKESLGISGKIVFLCPRRWAPTKGVVFFVEGISLLSEQARNRCVFLFAGSDFERYPAYAEQVKKYLLLINSNNFKMLGNLTHDEILKYYQIADVVVIPSLMEATSLAALEAMACSVPILGTTVGGIPEVVDDGVTGWLVPPSNAKALKEKMEYIISTPEILEKYGIEARRVVEKKFSWEKIAKQTKQIYNDVLETPN